MCGIVGSAAFKTEAPNLGAWYERLGHRGPDDAGHWRSIDGRVQLGHARLSIQDLSPMGHQPMQREGGRYVIVFNGEIYNFEILRLQLQQLGHEFRSSGDTEVVMAAYQQWGPQCVEHFNGMFALAILDQGQPGVGASLFLARDRAGEKPLYYMHAQGVLQFASELKALPHGRSLDLSALNHYLALGYVPADQCLFQGVEKLPPAHCATFDLQTGNFRVWRYWALPAQRPNIVADGYELAAQAGRLIEESVRMRLVADVPVGVLLSGGLDSSLVVAAAARVSSRPVETFTIALPGSALDEAHHAQKVASYFGTRHHVLPLDKPSLGLLDGLAPLIDEPIADSSILPAWMVFGLARKNVTVALGGDGGDELFGGYTDYTSSLADLQRLKHVPHSLLRVVSKLAAQLPAGVRGRNRLTSLREGALQQMIWGRPYFDEVLRMRLLTADSLAELGTSLAGPELFLLGLFNRGGDSIDRMTRTHFGSILPDDFLVKVDRASMAHSLEVRAPFLDHHLIEFCFGQVPSNWKVQDGESRRLQRLLAKEWLPPDLDTKRKQGFSIPINEWLRAEGEQRLMQRMEGLPSMIRMDEVLSLVRGHVAGRANGGRLFALIMLAIALRKHSQ
jgi:asparagine synthase (glutamine-hydrolysing)